jgi:threonine synthase
MIGENLKKYSFFFLLAVYSTVYLGSNTRSSPIDVYVIVDSSSAMERGKEEATAWLCKTLIDDMLLTGDQIWVWTAGDKPNLVYSGSLGNKETVKAVIRSIRLEGNRADYRGALEEARTKAVKSNRITYTLLISGSGAKDPPSVEAESAGLLRYSRVENFSGWRILTIGLDLDSKVRRTSAFPMR